MTVFATQVKEILVEESNVQPVNAPVTVRAGRAFQGLAENSLKTLFPLKPMPVKPM